MVYKMGRNSIYALKYGWHWTDFHEANAWTRRFVKNYTDFHENLTYGLFADARSHTDGRTDVVFPQNVLYSSIKNGYKWMIENAVGRLPSRQLPEASEHKHESLQLQYLVRRQTWSRDFPDTALGATYWTAGSLSAQFSDTLVYKTVQWAVDIADWDAL
jgi:hypothetical protein